MTPKRRWEYFGTHLSAAMVAHRLLSSAMCSKEDNDWSVNLLMLSLYDLRGLLLRLLPSAVPYSMIFGSVSWREIWPNHDNLLNLQSCGRNFNRTDFAKAPNKWTRIEHNMCFRLSTGPIIVVVMTLYKQTDGQTVIVATSKSGDSPDLKR